MRPLVALAVGLALTGACTDRDAARSGDGAPATPAARVVAHGKHRGVCFVAGEPVDEEVFLELKSTGVRWISQTPFGWQRRAHEPKFEIVTEGPVYWGETDDGLAVTTGLARKHGIYTLLKPHLWLLDRSRGQWEGSIAMRSEEDWARWFEHYERFIVHYAALADSIGAAALCVGTELEGTSGREADWRRVIAAVRRVYKGPLTYAANWNGEYERIAFWDALDFIGVQAYFPLAAQPQPDVDSLVAAWAPIRARLAAVAARTGKPIVFTEIGYRSERGAAVEPWRWTSGSAADSVEQAACYEAAFRALWRETWFGGTYWWKWFPSGSARTSRDATFSPQGKPALAVMAHWYGGSEPALTAAALEIARQVRKSRRGTSG